MNSQMTEFFYEFNPPKSVKMWGIHLYVSTLFFTRIFS